MTKSRGILPPRRMWTDDEIAVLKARFPHEVTANIASDLERPLHSIYRKADLLGIRKTEEYLASPAACRLRQGDNVGSEYRFPKGHVPPNKGIKGWQAGGRSIDTQFKKGHKSHTWLPIGTERMSNEGYLQRKVSDTGVTRRDYVPVHHIIWREAGFDIPKGHRLTFKDGNKQNIVLANLELVTIAEMMRRNSFHKYGKEIAGLVQLRGALTRQINRRKKNV